MAQKKEAVVNPPITAEEEKAIQEDIQENIKELETGEKHKIAKFIWKWIRKLALPVGVAFGYILKMIVDAIRNRGNDDDDLPEEVNEDPPTE